MTLDEAKALLVTLYRDDLVDHTFGDAEVYWSFNRGDDTPKAEGYFGRDACEVHIYGEPGEAASLFTEGEARELRSYGRDIRIRRNDGGGSND